MKKLSRRRKKAMERISKELSDELEKTGLLATVSDTIEAFNDYDRERDFITQITIMMQYGIEITEQLLERIIEVICQTTYIELDVSIYM